jgi:hypothetical protein
MSCGSPLAFCCDRVAPLQSCWIAKTGRCSLGSPPLRCNRRRPR